MCTKNRKRVKFVTPMLIRIRILSAICSRNRRNKLAIRKYLYIRLSCDASNVVNCWFCQNFSSIFCGIWDRCTNEIYVKFPVYVSRIKMPGYEKNRGQSKKNPDKLTTIPWKWAWKRKDYLPNVKNTKPAINTDTFIGNDLTRPQNHQDGENAT